MLLWRFFLLCILLMTLPLMQGCESPENPQNEGDTLVVCKDDRGDFNSIQAAVDAAGSGTVIEVCSGTYTENLKIKNKSLTLRAMADESPAIIEASSNESTIAISQVETPGVVIEGFVIQGGQNRSGDGGGIACQESTLRLTDNLISNNRAANGGGIAANKCSVVFSGNKISENQANRYGGGVYMNASEGRVEKNEIFENKAQEGGGLAVLSTGFKTVVKRLFEREDSLPTVSQLKPYVAESSPSPNESGLEDTGDLNGAFLPDGLKIVENIIRNNTASPPRRIRYNIKESGGGGIWLGGNSPLLNNIVKENESTINGGGIYVLNGNSTIVGNEIRGNKTAEDGGGLCINTCAGRLADNLITENSSRDDAGGIRVYFGLNMLIENNTISSNKALDASGGAKLSHSQNDFNNNLLENNTADTAGGLELDNDTSIVRNCTFKGNQARLGAAIHSKAAEDDLAIKDSTFIGNIASAYGGALHFEDNAHSVSLTGITARENHAQNGGVIATNNSRLELTDAVFIDNSAVEAGGAIFLSGFEEALKDEAESIPIDVTTNEEDPKLVKLRRVKMEGSQAGRGGAVFSRENTWFDGANLILFANQAEESGGGMSLTAANGVIANSVIVGNTAPSGAGVLFDDAPKVNVHNCIVFDNQAGEGVLIVGPPVEHWQYNNVYHNQGGDYAGMPSATGKSGNISTAPGFADIKQSDFTLSPNSPCIDAGNPDPVYIDWNDSPSDMGAYSGPDGNWDRSGQSSEEVISKVEPVEVQTEDPSKQDPVEDPAENVVSEDQTEDPDEPDSAEDQVEGPVDIDSDGCSSAVLSTAENFHWPAGGHEVILRAENGRGRPWDGPLECLKVVPDPSAGPINHEVAPVALGPGLTLIAVQPGISENLSVYRRAIESFISSRPKKERIALYGWGNEFVQIADFTLRRESIYSLMNRLERIFVDKNALSPEAALEQALEIASRVESPNLRGMRSVVFITGNSISTAIPVGKAGVSTQWVIPVNNAAATVPQNVVAIRNTNGLSNALAKISKQLDQDAQTAYYRVAACSDPAAKSYLKVSAGSGGNLEVKLGKSISGEEQGQCDIAQIAEGRRNGVNTVQFFLTDEELSVYEQRLEDIKALRAKYENLPDALRRAMILMDTSINGWGSTKEDWTLAVSLDPSQKPVEAKAHFRGQNALFCGRKSYTVNLSGKDARFFGEGSGSDEFYLIAMCQDPSLFHGYLADTFYSQYGLFPLRFRYVELLLNGETQGLYLMMEKRKEELQRDSARLRGIVRRKYEGMTSPEVDYAVNNERSMLKAYRNTVARNVDDEDLPQHLRELMDMDHYFQWMAINSILENADTLDECFFVSTESMDASGLPTDYFRMMSWDPEDIQGVCPSGNLHRNDFDLTFCQESTIERKIINHPQLFRAYVDILRQVLGEITPEKYQALLDQIRSELFPLLERDGVARAMQIPETEDAQSLQRKILEAMEQSMEKFEARRSALEDGIQEYDAVAP